MEDTDSLKTITTTPNEDSDIDHTISVEISLQEIRVQTTGNYKIIRKRRAGKNGPGPLWEVCYFLPGGLVSPTVLVKSRAKKKTNAKQKTDYMRFYHCSDVQPENIPCSMRIVAAPQASYLIADASLSTTTKITNPPKPAATTSGLRPVNSLNASIPLRAASKAFDANEERTFEARSNKSDQEGMIQMLSVI
jgi:hypothetical protein